MGKKKNIPALRFPGFEGEWEMKKFDDIYSNISTNSFSRDNLNYENGSVKNIHYGDIHTKFNTHFDITLETVPFINSEFIRKVIPEATFCQEGDVILADASEDYGDIGKAIEIVRLNNEKLVSGLHTIHFRNKDNLMALGFGGILMKSNSVRRQIMKIAQGTKVLSISPSRLLDIQILIPTKKEQTRIASFFTGIDRKIGQLKKKKKLLEIYKKGAMQQIFSQTIRFRNKQGKPYADWEEKKLGEVYCTLPTNSFSRENLNYEAGNIKNIHYGDIHTKYKTQFFINKEETPFVNDGLIKESFPEEYFCLNGDLVFADASEDYADVGKAIELVALNNEKVVAGLHTILARPNLSIVEIGFGGYLMKSPEVRQQIMKIAQGTKVLSISASRLSEIKLLMPGKEEQAKIAQFLSAIDHKINHCVAQLEKMQQWKKGLLQKMFC